MRAWREDRANPYAGTTGITSGSWSIGVTRNSREKTGGCSIVNWKQLKRSSGWLKRPLAERQGIEIPADGGDFTRWCAKMATGSAKTIVMAMAIAWQALNQVTYPQDKRFSKNIVVLAPGQGTNP